MKLPSSRRFLFLVPLSIVGFAALIGVAFAGLWSVRLIDQAWVDREFARLCQGEAFEPPQGLQPWEAPLPQGWVQYVPGPVSPFNTPIEMRVTVGKPVPRAILRSRKTGGLCTLAYIQQCTDPVIGDIVTSAPSTMTVIAPKTAVGSAWVLQWTSDWRDSRRCYVRLDDIRLSHRSMKDD